MPEGTMLFPGSAKCATFIEGPKGRKNGNMALIVDGWSDSFHPFCTYLFFSFSLFGKLIFFHFSLILALFILRSIFTSKCSLSASKAPFHVSEPLLNKYRNIFSGDQELANFAANAGSFSHIVKGLFVQTTHLGPRKLFKIIDIAPDKTASETM